MSAILGIFWFALIAKQKSTNPYIFVNIKAAGKDKKSESPGLNSPCKTRFVKPDRRLSPQTTDRIQLDRYSVI